MKFKNEFGSDPLKNKKAMIRLKEGCNKLKKTLSSNKDGLINLECFMEDEDLTGNLLASD